MVGIFVARSIKCSGMVLSQMATTRSVHGIAKNMTGHGHKNHFGEWAGEQITHAVFDKVLDEYRNVLNARNGRNLCCQIADAKNMTGHGHKNHFGEWAVVKFCWFPRGGFASISAAFDPL